MFLTDSGIESAYQTTAGTPLAVLGCPFESDGSAAAGSPPNGSGCANRQSISRSSDDHEQVQTARIDYNPSEFNMTWYRFQSDTGLQAAYTDPINPLFNASRRSRFVRWHPAILTSSPGIW